VFQPEKREGLVRWAPDCKAGVHEHEEEEGMEVNTSRSSMSFHEASRLQYFFLLVERALTLMKERDRICNMNLPEKPPETDRLHLVSRDVHNQSCDHRTFAEPRRAPD
jgi:hypothetical protein